MKNLVTLLFFNSTILILVYTPTKMSRVFVSAAIEERLRKVMKNSNMNFKHCALLTKGKRIISEGYNTRLDDSDNNLECCGIHAEICCIRRYFERIREGKDRQLRH